MHKLLIKELRLSASALTYFFIAFPLLTLAPGYPILVGAFFVCLGLFQSFQNGRETNDVLYTALLPVRKSDTVRAKYVFTCFIELCAFALACVLTALRMTVMRNFPPYVNNALASANLVFLAFTLLVYAAFNTVFLHGFFKTAYKTLRPFVTFAITTLVLVAVAETLWHIPPLAFLNETYRPAHIIILALAALTYAVSTLLSLRASQKTFDQIDL